MTDVTEITFEYAERSIDELQEEISFARVDVIGHGAHITRGVRHDEFAVRRLKRHVPVSRRLDVKTGLRRSEAKRRSSSAEIERRFTFLRR